MTKQEKDALKENTIEKLKKKLPPGFNDIGLLKKVFVHSSYVNETSAKAKTPLQSNETLEFLGDSVLSLAVSDMLLRKHPQAGEGRLTSMRARLVNQKILAGLAKDLCLNEHMLLGKGERATGGHDNPRILAGAFEALLGAMYLELGFEKVFLFIEGLFTPMITGLATLPGHFDFKPALQELTQRLYKETPVYRVAGEEGPSHKRSFFVEVIIREKVMGSGTALSKKEAEQRAAEEALKNIKPGL